MDCFAEPVIGRAFRRDVELDAIGPQNGHQDLRQATRSQPYQCTQLA
jgi:hypothetical protein